MIIDLDANRPLDVVPIGRIAIDFNPIDYFQTLEESQSFKKYLGGSPANIAVGLARLKKKVGFFAKISDDKFGDYVINFFEKEGIDVSHITRAKNGEKLGLTFTEILSPDESSILMYRQGAADLALEVSDIDREYIASAKTILISGTALCDSPSREACLKAAMLAKATDTKIIFDIDYRPYNWANSDEISIYYSIIAEMADIIMGSREEYDLTLGMVHAEMSDKKTAEYYLNKHAKIVIIKHGKKGSTAYTQDGCYNIKPFPVTALKSFGGGDGYGSAFIYALLEGYDIMEALELGSASASMLVSAHGCSEFMPNIAEIKAFIAKEKAEFGEMIARG